jgi:hypothetical protein
MDAEEWDPWDSFPPSKAVPLLLVEIARPIGCLVACQLVKCQAVSMDLQIAEPAINSAGSNGCN